MPEDKHVLSFYSKPVIGVMFYSWALERPDGGLNRSTYFPSKLSCLENCVRLLNKDLIDQEKIFIEADQETKDKLFEVLQNVYPDVAL